MNDDDLIELIRDFHERRMPELVLRELEVKLPKAKKCVSVIGPRRAGKASLLFSLVQDMRESGKGEHTLYVNLEDDRLYPPTTEVLDRVFKI